MDKNTNPHEHSLSIMKNLSPAMRYDGKSSFSDWQKTSVQKLTELLGLPLTKCEDMFEIEWEKAHDNFKEVRFTFQSEQGYFVPCHLLVPANPRENAKTIICLQGHSKGMHISLGTPKFEGDKETIAGGRDFAIQAVSNGHFALTMDQRGMGECGGTEQGPSCHIPTMNALMLGRTMIGQRVWDVSRAIDVLEKHFPKEMSSHIACLGNSGGGTTTFYSACLEPRIKTAVVSCAFCTYSDSIGAMRHCVCNFIPNIANYFDMGDLGGLIAPRNLLVVSGKEDHIFPLEGAKESFELTKSLYKNTNGKCFHILGDGGHRFYPDQAWEIINNL